jgi:hypothetical protein
MYIKNDMKAKLRFLHELEAAIGKSHAIVVVSMDIDPSFFASVKNGLTRFDCNAILKASLLQ